jgi:hypothetical protein
VDASIKVDWTAENTKAVDNLNKLLRSQATWTIIDPKISWKNRDLTTMKEERKVKQKIGKTQQHQKNYYDKKQRHHAIKHGDWVWVNKKNFPQSYFFDDKKATLNSKYSSPIKVLKVVNGLALLRANKNFKVNTRVNVQDLKWIKFWDKEMRMKINQHKGGGGESITATTPY